jgi:hypothetical protein
VTTDLSVPAADPVEEVAAAVLRCPAVARLHGGRFNAISSYLPGRRVIGVAVTPAGVTVGVVGRYPAPVAEIASQVRAAVATVVPGAAVTVAVEDLDTADVDARGLDTPDVDTRSATSPVAGLGTVREGEYPT